MIFSVTRLYGCVKIFCESVVVSAVLLSVGVSCESFARSDGPSVPEEYETVGGHALAFGGSTVTALGGVAAIRCNPALLALEKQYSVNGSYNWPVAGRDFYQLGIVDGKTSPIAAGFSYTSSMDEYQGIVTNPNQTPSNNQEILRLSVDTPVVRRASFAAAMPVGRLYLGFGSNYLEALPPAQSFLDQATKKTKGFTVGFGAAAHLSPSLRIGVSAENLANKKVGYAAPTFYRAGTSYFMGDVASFHLDYRRREALDLYEGRSPDFALSSQGESESSGRDESLINVSTSVRVYDLLRLVAAAGQTRSALGSSNRIAGGISLINENFDFSYQVLKLDMSNRSLHHALALGLDVAI